MSAPAQIVAAHIVVAHDEPAAGPKDTMHRREEGTQLVGRQVMAVTNFPPRQIGKFMSEVLTLGFADEQGAVVLATVDKPVPNGSRLH